MDNVVKLTAKLSCGCVPSTAIVPLRLLLINVDCYHSKTLKQTYTADIKGNIFYKENLSLPSHKKVTYLQIKSIHYSYNVITYKVLVSDVIADPLCKKQIQLNYSSQNQPNYRFSLFLLCIYAIL